MSTLALPKTSEVDYCGLSPFSLEGDFVGEDGDRNVIMSDFRLVL
jgi:hypothetical protein